MTCIIIYDVFVIDNGTGDVIISDVKYIGIDDNATALPTFRSGPDALTESDL